MSYMQVGQFEELIARKGYSGVGAFDTVSVGSGTPWAYKMIDGKWKCIDTRSGKQVSMDACTAYQQPPGAARTFMTGAAQIVMPSQSTSSGGAASTVPSGLPQWVIPVAIGAGALVLVMALKNKKQ